MKIVEAGFSGIRMGHSESQTSDDLVVLTLDTASAWMRWLTGFYVLFLANFEIAFHFFLEHSGQPSQSNPVSYAAPDLMGLAQNAAAKAVTVADVGDQLNPFVLARLIRRRVDMIGGLAAARSDSRLSVYIGRVSTVLGRVPHYLQHECGG